MKNSLQDILLTLPLHQLSFVTHLPKEKVYYETIIEDIPDSWLQEPTLLMIKCHECLNEIRTYKIFNSLMQDSNFVGLVICSYNPVFIPAQMQSLFKQFQIPIIILYEPSLASLFQKVDEKLYKYNQLSMELSGFIQKGFVNIAKELVRALDTPMLYLDSRDQLVWQEGQEDCLKEANRWLNTFYRNRKNYNTLNSTSSNKVCKSKEEGHCFKPYFINIGGLSQQTLIVSGDLVDWQKEMIDKFIGLTALLLQTEELFQAQQEQIQDIYIYELLYSKFESRSFMIKQGKMWGWNLEKPHYLLLINMKLLDDCEEVNLLEAISSFIKGRNESLIVFPFQGEIVVLVQTMEPQLKEENKKHIVEIGNEIAMALSANFTGYEFYIGIGELYEDSTSLNKSYQEAKMAIRFRKKWFDDKKVIHIQDLGILQLLINVENDFLYDYIERYLGELIDSNQENETDYLNTLKLYFQNDRKINELSKILFIHPNTIRYRLKKVENATGLQLNDSNDAMNLEIAVRLFYFLKEM